MHGSGILFGLGAAGCQSLSYLSSRWFVLQRPSGAWRLLIWAHLFMGAMSLLALPWAWSPAVPPPRVYLGPLIRAAGFYLAGQAGLFVLMRRTEASRIAPLLALKILILALISVLVLRQPLTAAQWLAALLCLAASLLLSQSGGALGPGVLALLAAVCTGYALSDLGIAALVRSLSPLRQVRASILGTALTYLLCGAAALPFWPAVAAARAPGEARAALPFAAFWLLGMVLLYACFAFVGPLYGNILQATRGLISIALGAWLARLGFRRLEPPAPRRVVAQRAAAAALMILAVWLFQRGS